MFVLGTVREGGRETDRQTDKQTEIDRYTYDIDRDIHMI